MMQLTMGGVEYERVTVEVRGYSYPGASDADDGNWLSCKVSVAVGGFRGAAECSLRTDDFVALEAGLRLLDGQPDACVEFTTMEEQLSFRIKGDGLGHFDVRGEVVDQPGVGNALRWQIELDRAQVSRMLGEVQAITSGVPVRGV